MTALSPYEICVVERGELRAALDTERTARLAAEAQVKVLETAIDNFNASIQQECCGQGAGPPDREPECCGQPDLIVDTQAMCALINVRAALKEPANG
jgi:hypothetical protein